ncbi:MAG: UDP-N-acetyl-D-glucosamine dehydrogenase [Elusimicrobia bacterium RIFCSPLOWO2_12_FULL_59_9]|nr:MAG: UDP-N-acetyl-D-glucosamine dehydrogenase [Elusimicrobia bacterium RIFCSPLOWO2_12_FULL_59_9]
MSESMLASLKNLIGQNKAKIGILGMGYVGLPLAVEFAKAGFEVTGFDVAQSRVRQINRGRSYIADVAQPLLKALVRQGKLRASSDFRDLKETQVIIICVPTPLRKSRDPDVSYIVSAAGKIALALRKGRLVILESTTYPGTTRELVLPLLEKTGLKAGRDFCLAFSPERVDPANQKFNIANTPKVVGGITPLCTEMALALYSRIADKVVRVSTAESAEMVKLLENTFRAVNIALVNEMALMCHRLKIDIWEIVRAAATKPFGFMPFYPGPGLGGHCIPLDPHYLAWKMKTLNFEPRFIELAGAINGTMPRHAVERLGEILNLRKRTIKGSRFLILGVAYKPNVSDYRESPALDIIELLLEKGARVSYHDPLVPRLKWESRAWTSVPATPRSLKKFDCVVIVTPHSSMDYRQVVASAKLVFDTRNATQGIKSGKIYKL